MKTFLKLFLLVMLLSACNLQQSQEGEQQISQITTDEAETTATVTPDPEETLPPYTPLVSVTPFQTLRPPPTFEPPTLTPAPSNTPTITPTPTIQIEGNLPALQGLNTATLSPDDPNACQVNEDWTLFYEVRANDALDSIAQRYNTYANVLAEGNCLDDLNLIRVGQLLRVPGSAHPVTPDFVCEPWELLTPFNGTVTVPGEGTITFNWRGPEAPRYLVRLYRTDNATGDHIREYLVEFRQNYTLDLEDIPDGGHYTWRVFPIGLDFLQIPCTESYYSNFSKEALPPTPVNQGVGVGS